MPSQTWDYRLTSRLKTRDLQSMFKEYENDKGGFRIKWVDDTNALVVFADAGVGTFHLCIQHP